MVFAVSDLKSAQKLQFSPKTMAFSPKNCGFHQNPWFSPKNAVFIKSVVLYLKICGFHKNWWFFLFLAEISTGKHLSIYGQTKDHLPRKVTPILYFVALIGVNMALRTTSVISENSRTTVCMYTFCMEIDWDTSS